jgi:hypothetical protein
VKVILRIQEQGDMFLFDKLLDRLIGKVKNEVEHSGVVTLEDLVAGSKTPDYKVLTADDPAGEDGSE